uniref:Putative secreted protein n=1 Tax=Ixodes ricinus TaxID=34613 RepID=A0A6B0UVR6_IXORI
MALIFRGVRSPWVVVESRRQCLWVQLVAAGGIAASPAVRTGDLSRLRGVEPVEQLQKTWESRPQEVNMGRTTVRVIEERFQGKEHCWRIGIGVPLHNVLGWHLGACLCAEDLLARNPTIYVHQVEPMGYYVLGDVGVPTRQQQVVEALVP